MSYQQYFSEISKNRKKSFFIWFAVYIFGFILLIFIGDSLQETSEQVNTLLGFFAPSVILAGILGMVYAMLKKSA